MMRQVKAGEIDCIYIYRMRQISGKEQHLFCFFQQVMRYGIKVVTLEYSLRDRLHEYRLGMKIENYIENAEVGSGLLIADKVVVPFNNTFPQDTELFRLMDTNPNSSKQKAPIKSL